MLGKTNRGFESLPVRPYYVPQSRDFEGLGGQGILSARGVIWMGLRVTGDQSLPVRSLVRTGCLISRRGRTDGAGAGPRGHIADARSAQIHQPGGVPAKISGQQGINPDRKCKFQLFGLGRAVCPQPASFNIYTTKRSARRRRGTPPYLIFIFPKQTQRALRSVGPGCGERDNPVRPLPVIFFGDACREAGSEF